MKIPELWFSKDDNVFRDYKVIDNESEENHLKGLSRVNIFIGPNNSGKSRFLREIFRKFFTIRITKSEIKDKEKWGIRIEDYKSLTIDFPIVDLKNDQEIIDFLNKIPDETPGFTDLKKLKSSNNKKKSLDQIVKLFQRLQNSDDININGGRINANEIKQNAEKIKKLFYETIDNYKPNLTFATSFRSTQIINNRGDLQNKYINNYFDELVNDNIKSCLFTGEYIYQDIQDLLLGGIDDIKSILALSEFISNTFYQGLDFSLSSPSNRNQKNTSMNLFVKIGNDEERPISELGDGIQNSIILLFPLFQNMKSDFIYFIDEPENHLHPGFQRILLETLLQERFRNTQTFICTHSNHFLDMSLDYPDDISIFSFHKKQKSEEPTKSYFEIKQVAGGDKTVLQSIGVRNSSVFLSNCTIWVEGITDRLYIRAWLAAYQKAMKLDDNNFKEYREDIHYSFVEFGGANITHWSFLDYLDEKEKELEINRKILVKSICGEALVIADDDNVSNENSEKFKRHKNLQNELGDDYVRLKRREIENLLPTKTLIETVESILGMKDVFNQKLEFSEYSKEYLGHYIDDRLKNGNKSFALNSRESGNSGTIKEKVKFCRTAVSILERNVREATKKDEISKIFIPENYNNDDTAWHLADRIYKFIEIKNT